MVLGRREFLAGAGTLALRSRSLFAGGQAVAMRAPGIFPASVRADFPSVARDTYLNSAALHPVGTFSAKAMQQVIDFRLHGPGEGRTDFGAKDQQALKEKYASLIGATADEIAYTSSTSDGENIVVMGSTCRRRRATSSSTSCTSPHRSTCTRNSRSRASSSASSSTGTGRSTPTTWTRRSTATHGSCRSRWCRTSTFENHLTFPEVAPFIEYVRASLSEDRKLWTSMFNGKDEYEALIGKITDVATRWFNRDGKLVMTKVVGGILATK